MKIFLISNMYPSQDDPDFGIFVRNIQESLEKEGTVITEKVVISGRVKSSFQKLSIYIKFYFNIFKAYRRGNFNLVYLHFISHSSPGLIIAKTLLGKRGKFIVNVHGSDVLKHNKGLLKVYNKKLLKLTDLLVVPSIYFKKIIEEVFPNFPDDKIYISPSGGIDLTTFYHQNNLKSEESLHLGFVSRIENDKGWRSFLEALQLLNYQSFPFKASIAGKGSDLSVMKELIIEFGLSDKVKYLGILSQSDLNLLYNNLDLFIFPTNRSSESLGLVGLEAMACGTPVIGSKIAGLETFISDKENGLFFTPGDEQELAEKIKYYFGLSENEKSVMQQYALKTAQEYDKNRVAENLFQKFKQLLIKT